MFSKGLGLTKNWILLFLVLINETKGKPLSARTPRISISLGPCTWVVDRTCPDDDIKFYLYTRQNSKDRQNIHVDETWEKSNISTSYFNPKHPVKIIIHGYNSDMFLHPLVQMKDEYLQKGDYNLFYIDWSLLSPGPCYISAVHNSRHTGNCIGQLIERILDGGSSNIHLIGFSLGAQVTNFVAQSLKNYKIPRITGLDPAMPLFITASIENKLDPTDAVFVDVIHTNALVQGKIERCGHVDFYMNGGIFQPGCFNTGESAFACSHHRAPDYYAESIRSYQGFWGWQCHSYIYYLLGLCPRTNYLIEAGENCNPESNGMYLVPTNDKYPFAMGKWPESLSNERPSSSLLSAPLTKRDPLSGQIDEWGKIEGPFNNMKSQFTMNFHQYKMDNFGSFDRNSLVNFHSSNEENIKTNNVGESPLVDTHRNKFHSFSFLNIKSTTQKPSAHNLEKAERLQFLDSYKKNLTNGKIDDEIFQLPIIQNH